MGGTGSAQAAIYTGNWDPAYGGIFPDLGWSASAVFDVPNACLALGNGTNIPISGACAGFDVLSAQVDFYDIAAPSTILDTFTLDTDVIVTGINIGGGQLTGVDTGFFDFFVPMLSIAGGGEYSFSLILLRRQPGAADLRQSAADVAGCALPPVPDAACGISANPAIGDVHDRRSRARDLRADARRPGRRRASLPAGARPRPRRGSRRGGFALARFRTTLARPPRRSRARSATTAPGGSPRRSATAAPRPRRSRTARRSPSAAARRSAPASAARRAARASGRAVARDCAAAAARPTATSSLALGLGELGMVLEAAEQLLAHLEGAKRAQARPPGAAAPPRVAGRRRSTRASHRSAFASPRLSPASRQTVSERLKRSTACAESPVSNATSPSTQLAFALDLLVADLAARSPGIAPGAIAPSRRRPASRPIWPRCSRPIASPTRSPRLAEDLQRFALAGGGLVGVAGLQPGKRQGRQGGGDVDLAAERAPQREAGLEHLARLGMVALALGQRSADVQRIRLGDRRRLDRRQGQRRLHAACGPRSSSRAGSRSPASRRRT